MTNTTLDPIVERVICTLAADRPDKWAEVLDGRTEARTWLIGMTSFHFGGEIDRQAVQAFIDEQVDRICELDAADVACKKTWAHSRMPQLTRQCGVPEDKVPVEDVVAMAVVEGTAAEFRVLTEDAEDVAFFDQVAAASVVEDDAAARLQASRDAIRDILGITSRRHHSEANGAGAANAALIREIEQRASKIRDLLDRSEG